MTSRKGHSFATQQLGTFLFCRQLGTVLAGAAGEPANRQRLSPMTSRLRTSPMTRWLGAGFGACEGEAHGGNGHGKECRDAQIAGDVAQHGGR